MNAETRGSLQADTEPGEGEGKVDSTQGAVDRTRGTVGDRHLDFPPTVPSVRLGISQFLDGVQCNLET